MTDKYAKLREAAEKATPGEWFVWEGELCYRDNRGSLQRIKPSAGNAAYIAAANPQAVLALLDHLAAEKARADAAEAERDELLAWSKTITTKLSDAIGLGSEMFRRHGEQYRVDPDFVATYIRDRRQSFHEAMLKNAEARNRDRTTLSTLNAERDVSIGIETGPPIGSQKGPLPLVASGQRA